MPGRGKSPSQKTMSTLESAISTRMTEYDSLSKKVAGLEAKVKHAEDVLQRAKDGVARSKAEETCVKLRNELLDAKRADEEKIEYLLDVLPFIKEYTTPHQGEALTSQFKPINSGIEQFVDISENTNKNEILVKYLANIERDETAMQRLALGNENIHEADVCSACGNRLVFKTEESILCCESCGLTKPHFEGSARNLSYDEEVSHSTRGQFCYKKFNHLLESLNSIQGKENTTIPDKCRH